MRISTASRLFGVLLTLACLSSISRGQTTGIQRLDWEHHGAIQPLPPRELTHESWGSLDREERRAGWNLGGTEVKVLAIGEQQVLIIDREQPVRIEIPVDLRFRDVPRLTFEYMIRGAKYELEVLLLKDGQVLSQASAELTSSRASQLATLSFPGVRSGELHANSLAIVVPAGRAPLGLIGFEIGDKSMSGSVPLAAYRETTRLDLHGDTRSATCISPSAPLSFKFQVEQAGEQLRFSYGIPKDAIQGPALSELRLTLRSPGVPDRSQALDFAQGDSDPSHWQVFQIQLGGYAGKQVSATLELQEKDGAPLVAVVERPRLIRKRSNPQSILLVTSEGHRADHIGFLDETGSLSTPTLDRLASSGVSFLDVSSSSNSTAASLKSLLSGQSSAELDGLHSANKTLPELFADLGFGTLAVVSSSSLAGSSFPINAGFDRFSYPTDLQQRSAQNSIDELKRWLPEFSDLPLFVWVHLNEAAPPYAPPEEWVSKYYNDGLDPYDMESPIAVIEYAPSWDPLIADPFYTEALHDASVSYLDSQLGQLFEIPRFTGGIVAFTATQGQNLRRGGAHRFASSNLTGSTLSVPLLLSGPGLTPGEHRAEPVSLRNLGSTLLDLAGQESVSFIGTSLQRKSEEGQGVRFAMGAGRESACVLRDNWLLQIRLSSEPLDERHKVSLFQVTTDPNCLTNLSESRNSIVAELRTELALWLAQRANGTGPAGSHWLDPDCPCEACR